MTEKFQAPEGDGPVLTKAQIDACWDGYGKSRYDIAAAISRAALATRPERAALTTPSLAAALILADSLDALGIGGSARCIRNLVAEVQRLHAPAPLELREDSQAEQAAAWMAVVAALHEVAPGWCDPKGTGLELAVAAIRSLAAKPQPATGDVWLKHDDDLRFVARVLSGGMQAPKNDIWAARQIVNDLRTTARAHAQAPEGDELPPLNIRLAAALREIAKPLAKGSKSIVERAANVLGGWSATESAPFPCDCPDRGYCDGSCAPNNQPSDDLPNIVKTAPETIYLVIDPDLSLDANFTELMRSFEDSVQWCSEDSYDNGIKYIRADLKPDVQPKGTVDLYVGLIERLMALSTRLGISYEPGVENFGASIEDRLYAICRSTERVLDSLAAPSPAPAPEGQAAADYKAMFLDAARALAEIDYILGLPEDGCNDPQVTVSALKDYVAGAQEVAGFRDQWVDAQYATAASQAPAVGADPCPGCRPGVVCRTPKCGRLQRKGSNPPPPPLGNKPPAPPNPPAVGAES